MNSFKMIVELQALHNVLTVAIMETEVDEQYRNKKVNEILRIILSSDIVKEEYHDAYEQFQEMQSEAE